MVAIQLPGIPPLLEEIPGNNSSVLIPLTTLIK
jgi:hypothetical protein